MFEKKDNNKNEADVKRTGVLFFDNGTTGTIGWRCGCTINEMIEVPVKKRASFHKSPRSTTIIDVDALEKALRDMLDRAKVKPCDVIAYRERPMINPKRWQASMSASRADEAETIVLERMGIEYHYVDSKAWQRHILPSSGKKGTTSDILKAESKDIGCKMFENLSTIINKHGDADGILGALVFDLFDYINDKVLPGVPNWKLQYDSPCQWTVIDPDYESPCHWTGIDPDEEKNTPNPSPDEVKDEGEKP